MPKPILTGLFPHKAVKSALPVPVGVSLEDLSVSWWLKLFWWDSRAVAAVKFNFLILFIYHMRLVALVFCLCISQFKVSLIAVLNGGICFMKVGTHLLKPWFRVQAFKATLAAALWKLSLPPLYFIISCSLQKSPLNQKSTKIRYSFKNSLYYSWTYINHSSYTYYGARKVFFLIFLL